jgi:NAD(P)-dependent dehydrogenase (short-subunit alcohol dehydrogenase family)
MIQPEEFLEDQEKLLSEGEQMEDAQKASEEFIARIPLKRPGTVDDMAAAALFLCSSESDYITGQTLNVDGGFEMN